MKSADRISRDWKRKHKNKTYWEHCSIVGKKKKLPFGPTDKSVMLICPPGLASICSDELKDLIDAQSVIGRSELKHLYIDSNRITCSGLHYREVFSLSRKMCTIYGFYFLINQKVCTSKDELKSFLSDIDFESYLPKDFRYSIRTESFSSTLYHEKMIKDIFVDLLKAKGFSQESDTDDEDGSGGSGNCGRFFLLVKNERVSLWISPVGFPLNRRIYKQNLSFCAPLREDIAAALIYRLQKNYSQNQKVTRITVPFCGTGTFVFEAVYRLLELAPGMLRNDYFCSHWDFWPEGDFIFDHKKMVQKAAEIILPEVVASDIEDEALNQYSSILEEFSQNLTVNGISMDLNLKPQKKDSLEEDWSANGFSWIMLNPPYGWRLDREENLFKKIASKILDAGNKSPVAGFCLCPDEESWSQIKNGLGELCRETVHFSLGGRQIRSVFFSKP